jgi:hypothetical protein
MAAVVGNANWSFEDTPAEINSITFGNLTGAMPIDLPYASQYVNVVRKIDSLQVEFEGNDYTSCLYKAKSLAIADNPFPPGVLIPTGTNVYGEAGGSVQYTSITVPDAQYSRASAQAASLQSGRSLPLSAFKGTIFAMDKDLCFGDDMYLTVNFAPSSRAGFTTTLPTDPLVGMSTVFATQPTISNLFLNLATQEDPDVKAYVLGMFDAGKLECIFPYVHTARTPGTAAGGQQSVTVNYPANLGKTMKRIVHTCFNSTEAGGKQYDHGNMNGSKVISYRTSLDTSPLQDNIISCLQPTCDDFRENRQYLKGSALENSAIYYYNWCHIDSWSNPLRDSTVPVENIMEGLPMTAARQWVFDTTTASLQFVFYTFASFTRKLVCKPGVTEMQFNWE